MMKEMDANQVKADGKQEEILAKMWEEIKSSQAEMRSTPEEWLMDLKDGWNVMTTCNEVTETEPNPRMM
jgi:hypothetical protein